MILESDQECVTGLIDYCQGYLTQLMMQTHISIFRDQLSRVFDLVNDVDLLDSRDPTNLQLLGRPDLNVTFTKFHCWRLTMYDKAVFLDADTLVCHSCSYLT